MTSINREHPSVGLASSMAAVIFNGRPLTPDVVIDETWFSDPLVCENLNEWYFLSKTLAVGAAWKFAIGNGIDLVTINPSYVIGPLLQPSLNLTVEMILNLKDDIEDVNSSIYTSSDVRDVASAHVQAFEVPSANGRYCLVGHVTPMAKVLKILHDLHPSLCPPEKYEEANPSEPTFQVSQEKAKSLGVNFLPLEISLRDTIESLKEKGFLKNGQELLSALDSSIEETLKWYVLSKTLAEEAAWKFAEGNGIDLVTINPSYVIGPLLQPSLNITVEMILNFNLCLILKM
ncbi:PREDICTED: cinnamoyl-CoA reductase 1-like [Prunus mume]|uniref:Cinnamoyl-CoA reductase 1-like n=1 Tax=Prunus mume TaxID=102107 RepID=A0ABM0NY13_PRUMU|nr:PREDICTED: cinnamoyl-CoA reductase 1-like [Prunus mume]